MSNEPYTRTSGNPDWRGSDKAVAVMSIDVDAESPILARHPDAVEDLSTMSHQAYGPLVGVPRMLDLLDRMAAPASFFVPGATADRWPNVVRDIQAAGHEIALHSYAHASLPDMGPAAQRRDFEKALTALHRLGVEPVGYRAPLWQLTATTLDRILDEGLLYDSSLMDHDQPYVLERGGRHIVELPVHWSLDDWEQYAFLPRPDVGQQIETPAKVLELWMSELEAMQSTNSLCMITCHPFLSARPSRLRVLEDFISAAQQSDDVRLDTCRDVARRALPHPVSRPNAATPASQDDAWPPSAS